MGRLTTHVLDTAAGKPAAGLTVSLFALKDGAPPQRLKMVQTNADGRVDQPLLEGSALQSGKYRLVFEVGSYFQNYPMPLTNPMFLDHIPLDFGIGDTSLHYHVPLLVSPWAYATYRGS